MSRFAFCNCPAGFAADPERHAPDCPGRSGAGKPGRISHERFQELMGNRKPEPSPAAHVMAVADPYDGGLTYCLGCDSGGTFSDVPAGECPTPYKTAKQHQADNAELRAELDGLQSLIRHCLKDDLAGWQGDYRIALERAVQAGQQGESWPVGNVQALNAKLAQARCELDHASQQRDAAYAECKRLRAELERKQETGVRVATNLLNQLVDDPRTARSPDHSEHGLNMVNATLVALLERCQEKLDPHRDAVLWGEVVDALRAKP